MIELVSKPDHGEEIIDKFNDQLVASQRLQVFFDDIADKINEIGGSDSGSITPDNFLQSSIIYKPSIGTSIEAAIIEENEVLGRLPGGEIMGLDFQDNWSILGNGSGNIRINDTSNAVSFTIESNTSSTMFVVNGSTNRVGVAQNGLTPNDGTLHVLNSVAVGGAVTADLDGNELVLEHDFFGGMSILNGSNGIGNIFFGSPAYDNRAGNIWFFHDTDFLLPRMGFDIREKTFLTMYDTIGSFFNEFQDTDIDFQINTLGSGPFLQVDSSANRLGLSNVSLAPIHGLFHIIDGGVSGFAGTPAATFDSIVIESNSLCGITFLAGTSQYAGLAWGDRFAGGDRPFQGNFVFKADSDFLGRGRMEWRVDDGLNARLYLTAVEFTVNPVPGLFTCDFRVRGFSSGATLLFVNTKNGANRTSISNVDVEGTDGVCHIIEGGFVTGGVVSASADTLVLESNTGNAGMTIVTDTTGVGRIFFADTLSAVGQINYDHTGDFFQFVAAQAGEQLRISGTEVVVNFSGSPNFEFRVASDTNSNLLRTVSTGAGIVGMSDVGLAPTDGLLHIIKGGLAGVITADSTGSNIVIESDTIPGISFLSPNNQQNRIFFGDTDDATKATFQYNHFGNAGFQFYLNNITTFMLSMSEAAGFHWNVDQGGAFDFRVASEGSSRMIHVHSAADRVGISDNDLLPTDGLLHIQPATAGVVDAVANRQLVVENSGEAGLQLLGGDASFSGFNFGSALSGNSAMSLTFRPSDGTMFWSAGGLQFLKFDAAGFQVNDAAADIDFRVESVASQNLIHTDATLNVVGISRTSLAPVHGALHIQQADAGVIAPSANADLIVMEGTGEIGMSFLVDNLTGFANLNFGDPSNGNVAGQIRYDANAASWFFSSTGTEMMRFNPTLGIVINETGAAVHDLRVESVGSNHIFFVDSGNNRIGIADNGFAPSDGLIHVFQGGSAGVVAAHANADTLVLESNTHAGLNILVPNDGTTANIYMGAPTSGNNGGQLSYVPSTGLMTLATSTLAGIKIDTDQNILLGTVAAAATSAAGALHIPNDTSPTAVLANGVVLGSKDSGAGGTLAVPEIWIEEPPEVVGTFTPTMKMKIWINGTEYFIQLDPV